MARMYGPGQPLPPIFSPPAGYLMTTCDFALVHFLAHERGKRGVVQYVGKIPQIAPGWWIGVQYDEPGGKNDGTGKGKRFFECPPKYGGFLRPDKLQVGDYPELDDLFSDEDADDEGESGAVS